MKAYLILPIVLFACFLFLIRCSILNRKDCPNKVEKYFNNTITYVDNEIVEFVNDSGQIKSETVHIDFPSVEESYVADNTDTDFGSCGGNFYVNLGDYEISGGQATNMYNNTFGVRVNLYDKYIDILKDDLDTINYMYNDSILIKSIHIVDNDTAGLGKDEKFCKELYFSATDLRLLKYSVIENNVQTNWRLK